MNKFLLVLLFLPSSLFAIEARIVDGHGTRNKVKVTGAGQLVTGMFDFNISSQAEIGEVDTAVNFLIPIVGQRFVIDCLILFGDRQVQPNDNASVQVFEATSTVSRTVSKILYRDEIAQSDRFALCGLNLEVREGFFINATTTDDDIHMNLIGYFLPRE